MSRSKYVVIITLLILISTWTSPAVALDSITFGRMYDRQRINTDPYLPPAEQVWVNSNVSQSITQPLVIGDKIYHASARWLWELPLADGSNGKQSKLFEIDTGETITTGSHPSFYENIIYVGSKNGFVYAYDVVKRTILHKRQVAGEYGVVSSPLVMKDVDGKINVIVGSSDGKVVSIFKNFNSPKENDVIKIDLNPGGNVTSSPSQVNQNVFVFSTNHSGQSKPSKVIFYNLTQTKPVWEYVTKDGIPSSVAVSGNLAFAADKTGNLYALDFGTKSLKWSNSDYAGSDTFVNFSPAIAGSKVIFPIRRTDKAGAKGNGILTAWDQNTGKKLWATSGISGEITTSPVVWSAGNLVLVGTSTGRIHGFDLTTGRPKGWFTTDGGKTLSATGWLSGSGSDGSKGDIRPDGITTEFSIANGYLLGGGVKPDGSGCLVAFKLTGSDVGLTAFQADKLVPEAGEQVNLNLTVHNYGDTPRDLTVRVQDNRTGFSRDVSFAKVPANSSASNQLKGWVAPAGKVTVTAQIVTPAGGSKYNYTKENDTKALSFFNGVDLQVDNLRTTDPVYTGDTLQASLTVLNKSKVELTTTVQFLLNNNPKLIPSQQVTLQPESTVPVSFAWTAPATGGQATLKAIVNPSRTQPVENDFTNNTASRAITVRTRDVENTTGRLSLTVATNPTSTKAGYGFEIIAQTSTSPYSWTETHSKIVKGRTVYYTDTHTRVCPGATRVKVVLPTGESISLEPDNQLGSPVVAANTWRLPANAKSPEQLRKHYIPPATPDGRYLITVVAEGAGDEGNLTARSSATVMVTGSMYDDLHSRIIE